SPLGPGVQTGAPPIYETGRALAGRRGVGGGGKAVRGGRGATARTTGVAIAADLGDAAAAAEAVEQAIKALGGLDALIVNHGVWPADDVPVAAMSDAQWEATRRANLASVLYVCRAAIPLLPDGGKIVLVSSTAGQRGEE